MTYPQYEVFMNISLTPELEKYVHDKVNCGLYTSASEVVRESLRIMHTYEDLQKQRISQLGEAIDLGMRQLRQGKKTAGRSSYLKMKNKISKITKGK